MDYLNAEAVRITEKIVVASMYQHAPIADKDDGDDVGEYFDAIYEKVFAVLSKADKRNAT